MMWKRMIGKLRYIGVLAFMAAGVCAGSAATTYADAPAVSPAWRQAVQETAKANIREIEIHVAGEAPIVGAAYAKIQMHADATERLQGVADIAVFGAVNEQFQIPFYGERKDRTYVFYYKLPEAVGGFWLKYAVPNVPVNTPLFQSRNEDYAARAREIEPHVFQVVYNRQSYERALTYMEKAQNDRPAVRNLSAAFDAVNLPAITLYVRVDPESRHIVHAEGDLTSQLPLLMQSLQPILARMKTPLAGYNLVQRALQQSKLCFFVTYRYGTPEPVTIPMTVKEQAKEIVAPQNQRRTQDFFGQVNRKSL